MRDTAPEDEQQDTDEDKGKRKTDPKTKGSPVATETEPGAEWKADEPVGSEMADHGSAGVARAAKRAGGDGLNAVEELKRGSGGEQRDGTVNDDFVGGVEAGDIAGEDKKNDAHQAHERGAKEDGGIAGVARIG